VKLGDDVGPDSSMAADLEAAGEGINFSSESTGDLPGGESRISKKTQRTSKNGGTAEVVDANGVLHSGGQEGVSKHGIYAAHRSHRRRRHARGRVLVKKGNNLFKLGGW